MTLPPARQAMVNGRLLPEEKAYISIDERGFRFGDGVFETIPVYAHIPYLWEYHLARLEAGLRQLRIECELNTLHPHVLALIKANDMAEGLLRISVTRGIGSRGYMPAGDTAPTIVMQVMALPATPAQPVTLWLSGIEKISPRALPVESKLAHGINPMLARMEAADHGCYDALQLNAQGHLTEASSANLFWLKDGALFTPSLACGVLAGVTRKRLMELSPRKVIEGSFTPNDLQGAEAVFLSNASFGIVEAQALLPGSFTWRSSAVVKELAALRLRDVAQYCTKARESLA